MPQRGSVFLQSVVLGCSQIAISFSVNLLIVLSAARIAAWFARNPRWLSVQRYLMVGRPGGARPPPPLSILPGPRRGRGPRRAQI